MSLDGRICELISVGVSVGVNCQPCLQYHVAKAKENGASEQEIQEAIRLGKNVRKGAMHTMDQYIATLWEDPSSLVRPTGKDEACGCSGK